MHRKPRQQMILPPNNGSGATAEDWSAVCQNSADTFDLEWYQDRESNGQLAVSVSTAAPYDDRQTVTHSMRGKTGDGLAH